jgi:hypothetical protein
MSDCKIQHLLSPLFEFVFLVSRHCFTPSFHLNHTFGILWHPLAGIFFTGTVAFSIPLQQLLSIDAFWKGQRFQGANS